MRKKIIKKIAAIGTALAFPGIALANWTVGLGNIQGTGLPQGNTIQQMIINTMNWILIALASIAIIGFVIAGIMYLLSGGDDARMKTAKNAMLACIIGVVVGIMGLVIITAVTNFLNATTF